MVTNRLRCVTPQTCLYSNSLTTTSQLHCVQCCFLLSFSRLTANFPFLSNSCAFLSNSCFFHLDSSCNGDKSGAAKKKRCGDNNCEKNYNGNGGMERHVSDAARHDPHDLQQQPKAIQTLKQTVLDTKKQTVIDIR